ncbi:MAG: 4'-phosphopantetheinyl transferase superfamily protein [Helicobacter sp.]|nr:4'-phosphopantetheinyl transferase superfamily protein [Helicobacter sp.]
MISYFAFNLTSKQFQAIYSPIFSKQEDIIIFSFTAPVVYKIFDDCLDEQDKIKIKQSPNLLANQNFISSRFLKFSTKTLRQFYPFYGLSHTKGYAIQSHSHIKVGIDLEKLSPRDFSKHLDFCFNSYEKTAITMNQNPLYHFYKIWTLKEAIIKLCDLSFANLSEVGLNLKGAFYLHDNSFIDFSHQILQKNILLSLAWKI